MLPMPMLGLSLLYVQTSEWLDPAPPLLFQIHISQAIHYEQFGCSVLCKRFEGLELDGRLKQADSEPWCGVQVIDLSDVTCKEWFRIDDKISELYDVEVLPSFTCPRSFGFLTNNVLCIITVEEELRV